MLPPDIEEAVRLWHAIGSGDVLRLLYPTVERVGEADAATSMREWLALYPRPSPMRCSMRSRAATCCLWRWLEFFGGYPVVLMPTHCDLPPPLAAGPDPRGAEGADRGAAGRKESVNE